MTETTIKEIHKKLLNKKISCEDLVCGYFGEIEKIDSEIHAFLEVFKKEALAEAKKVDAKIKKGEELKVLEGIPIAIKDNLLY